jgi:hypothetical protein
LSVPLTASGGGNFNFGFDGNNDIAKLDTWFDKRVKADPDFDRAVQNGLTKASFRRYYAARRMEHLPDDRRASARRRETRHAQPDPDAVRRPQHRTGGRRARGIGGIRRQVRDVNRGRVRPFVGRSHASVFVSPHSVRPL